MVKDLINRFNSDDELDIRFTILSVVVTIVFLFMIFHVYSIVEASLVIDRSSSAKTYEKYIDEKNSVFVKRYNAYFLKDEKLFPQYYVESAIYSQFVDEEQSEISKFTEDYMSIDESVDTFNIAPSSGTVENIECAYVNSDTLMDDLEARFGSSVRLDLDDSLL